MGIVDIISKNWRTSITGAVIILFAVFAWWIGKLLWAEALPLFGVGWGFLLSKDGQSEKEYRKEAVNILTVAEDEITKEISRDDAHDLARRADELSK